MFTHPMQHEKRQLVPVGEIDRSPLLVDLVIADALPPQAGAALVGWGLVRTLGAACRLGRRELRRLPGLGPVGLAALERIAAAHGIEVAP